MRDGNGWRGLCDLELAIRLHPLEHVGDLLARRLGAQLELPGDEQFLGIEVAEGRQPRQIDARK